MNLSTAIQSGASSINSLAGTPYHDPLGAAYLGAQPPDSLPVALDYARSLSEDSFCSFMVKNLYRLFPQLGASVRAWPRLATELECRGLVPRTRPYQREYRQAIHVSLWRVITDLHKRGSTLPEIADLLGRHGV